MLCLPTHVTQYLHPLDRSFFKSLEAHYYEPVRRWMHSNPGEKITLLKTGELLKNEWEKAATTKNATAGFEVTGIYRC
jgi:hypothetical protein